GAAPLFSMTILALRLSKQSNGVSQLHGEVSRKIWKDVWPDIPEGEVPITAVTNGIHTETWLGEEIAALHERHLGPDWREHIAESELWTQVRDYPDDVLWGIRRALKEHMIAFLRQRMQQNALR